jgi:NADH-quinone oxidoreductase subunit G
LATIYIENEPRQADATQNLLHVLLSLGYDLPYFCWHPALGSVGACRQCAVKQFRDEQDTTGKLVMACMTPSLDGTRVSIKDREASEFRAAVIQGLMENHPHDCPVCDEGGECHLQDMTVMTGHASRRYRFDKRTFRNQHLGPLINHEMNRCIQCQRCVRYYREYAGGHDLNAFRLRDTVYFGRFEDGVLENEFSGNLVEVCPTGVFTDATLKRHYTRKWDLQMSPSVCVHCAAGCNTSIGERYGALRRVVNRYNHEVNGYFLCDRGRFGYEFVNNEQRIRECTVNGQTADLTSAMVRFGAILRDGKCIGVGSPRASLESNFSLRQLVGPDNFYSGVADEELSLTQAALEILKNGPARSPSLNEVEQCDAVFVLGEDVTNVLPIMALRLRQAARQQPIKKAKQLRIPLWLDHPVRELLQDEKGPFFIASPYATKLDEVATERVQATPDDIARLGFAVAHAVEPGAPPAPDLPAEMEALAHRIAEALRSAESPLVVSGTSCGSKAVIEAAAQVAWALCRRGKAAKLSFCFPECNSAGLALMQPQPLSKAFQALEQGRAETVVILENDLYRRVGTRKVTAFLDAARHVIAVDHLPTSTTERAEIVFPAATFAEADGTLVNNEGRAQRFFQAFVPAGQVRASWRWLGVRPEADLSTNGHKWQAFDQVVSALVTDIPELAGVQQAAPGRGDFGKVAREPNRYSGRTSMLANISVHEPKPADDPDSALAFSMESGTQAPPPALNPFFWSPGWNSIQSVNKFQHEIGGALQGGDPGIRLVESKTQAGPQYFSEIPPVVAPDPENWLILPCFHIFGSEELSRTAPAISELVPSPYIALRPEDGALLGVKPGEKIKLSVGDEGCELKVVFRTDVPQGIALVPSALTPLNGLPTKGRLVPVAEAAYGVVK